MRAIHLSVGLLILATACGDSVEGTAGAGGTGGSPINATLTHTFEPITIQVGEELGFRPSICQRWTLNNDEPLYVSKVRQTNNGAWHHSNWFFVPENIYVADDPNEDPDGTFLCSERDFREYLAAAAGGVFFAQSTQAFEEIQAFPAGAVLEVPPRHAIVGDVHLVNVSAAPLDSALTMEIETIPEDQVETLLHPISFSNNALDIPAGMEARYAMTCDMDIELDVIPERPAAYNIYYVLAHYHQWGNYFKLSFMDDLGDERSIFEFSNRFGEPIGATIDPPLSSEGAKFLRMECGYMNTTDRVLTYGFNDFEMCVMLAYTDATFKVGKSTNMNMPMGMGEDGILRNEAGCESGLTIPTER